MGTVHLPARARLFRKADGDRSCEGVFQPSKDGGLQRLTSRGWGPLSRAPPPTCSLGTIRGAPEDRQLRASKDAAAEGPTPPVYLPSPRTHSQRSFEDGGLPGGGG